MRKIFSVPLNPKLNPEQYKTYCKFLLEHKEYIKAIYFTSRITHFMQDAMGDVFVYKEDYDYAIDQALNIQNTIGIPVSATFNNIKVPPTQKNLDIFIKHFKPLYDKGIRISTITHTHWMGTGQIKKAFPVTKKGLKKIDPEKQKGLAKLKKARPDVVRKMGYFKKGGRS